MGTQSTWGINKINRKLAPCTNRKKAKKLEVQASRTINSTEEGGGSPNLSNL